MFPEEIQQHHDYNAGAQPPSADRCTKTESGAIHTFRGFEFLVSARYVGAHRRGAERIWLERFQGKSPSSLPDLAQFQDVTSWREHWLPQEQRRLGFGRELTRSALERKFEYETLKFGASRNPLWQSLLHVVNHGTCRGQGTTLL